jgi:hypothetical protein
MRKSMPELILSLVAAGYESMDSESALTSMMLLFGPGKNTRREPMLMITYYTRP